MTMMAPPSLASQLDMPRCTQMALVHDMAESLVGDLTPVDGIDKEEKHRREAEAMDYLCETLLGNVYNDKYQDIATNDAISHKLTADDTATTTTMNTKSNRIGPYIRSLWQEYEDSTTSESLFVHDVDKIELLLQMVEYERAHEGRLDLAEFTRVGDRVVLEEMKGWAGEVLEDRRRFWHQMRKQ